MGEIVIKVEHLRKKYRLGAIGGTTLNAELQSWWARKRGKDDPNLKLGQQYTKSRDYFLALDDINVEVRKGEALGVIGGNGAGKSTLLKILSRVTAPTEGDIWINGRIASMLEVGTGFHGELTGRENIYMNGAILGMTKKEVDSKIDSIIEFSECGQFIDTPVKRYSSGMYVKLAFAVASHLDAEIMVMDEVLAVGDVKFQRKCLSKMGDAANYDGKTVLYVSHNMATISSLCTRCIVLQKGKKIFDGDVSKAIDIYMGSDSEISDSEIDNTVKDRGTEVDRLGKHGIINHITFLNKKKLIFKDNESIKIDIEVEAYTYLENLFMGIAIYLADKTPIGFEYVSLPNMEESEISHYQFEVGFHELPSADYKMVFNLHRQNELGGWDRSIDQSDYLNFRVENSGIRLQWRRDWFGPVEFKSLKFIR